MPTIAPLPLEDYVSAIFTAVGCGPAEASAIGRRLVSANLVGHDSHGVVRVADYVQRLKAGKIMANRHAEVITDSEVRRAARELRKGASYIKIMASGGVVSPSDPIWNLQYSKEEIAAAMWERVRGRPTSWPTRTPPR